MLSAFYVLARKITGHTDLSIRAFTAGRNEQEFQNTIGLFLNCVPFRTDIADCTTFRDIVVATRETFVDAMAHELPVHVIEQTFPDFIKPREDLRTSQFVISNIDGQFGDDPAIPIAEGARAAGHPGNSTHGEASFPPACDDSDVLCRLRGSNSGVISDQWHGN
jgi:non-ribosomal peptide synthetase component F